MYSYSIFCLYIDLAPFLLGFLVGYSVKLNSVTILLFLLPFVMLRRFCGGYHAKSLGRCLLISIVFLVLFSLLIRLSFLSWQLKLVVYILSPIAGISLMRFSPVDTSERHLGISEMLFYRKVVVILLSILFSIILTLTMMRRSQYSIPLSVGIIFTGILQIPVIITKHCFHDQND